MAVPLAIPIATTVGEFAAPYLIRKAGKLGIKKFIETYGSTAWQSIAGVTGGMIAQLTEPVDLQTEKILGMPVRHITGQGEVYSDIDEDKEKQIPTKVTEGEPTTPTEPEPPEDPDVGADLAAEAAIHTTKKLLEDKKTKDITKQTEELVKKELSVSQQTDDLVTKTKTKHYKGELTATDTLNSDLMDALVKLAGTPEDIAKSSKLPQSHKKKIFWSLEDYITKHYPAKLNEAESHHEGEALFYITSAIYDAYTNNGKVPNNIILIEDDKGIPMGAAEIEIYPKGKMNYYPKRKTKRMVTTEPAIYIEGIGSFNRKTTDLLLEKIELLAEAEGIRYIVGEDLTSEGALKTLSLRGFKPGKKGFFEGELINKAMWRGGKKNIKAKNMVLDLGEKYATTQEEINKEFEKERIQEQTEKLTSKITLEKVRSDVKFKLSKYANITDVYYKGKKYAEIEKRPDKEKYKGLSDYDLKYPSGTFLENGEEVFTTEDAWLGFKDAKDALIQGIYNDLKRKKELK